MKDSGIMDNAKGRLNRSEFVYRYKVRALAAVNAAPSMKGGALLDLGCADGLTLKEIIREGLPGTATGVEYSPELVETARKNGLNVLQGNVEALPEGINSGSFDVVTALAVIEHLDHPERCFSEVKRVLKPGGIFIASSSNSFWDDLAGFIGIHKGKGHHINEVNTDFFKTLCDEQGLKYIETLPFMFVVTAFLPYLKIVPSAGHSLFLDELLTLPFTSPLFVNRLFVARKSF
ncbi:MAG: class I SAM-dependent methyltransferase [Deltaproteobacteria bacterium]|nr:class I SAM-dependent methyltransferase [Deltaproteobacteria bacterium]